MSECEKCANLLREVESLNEVAMHMDAKCWAEFNRNSQLKSDIVLLREQLADLQKEFDDYRIKRASCCMENEEKLAKYDELNVTPVFETVLQQKDVINDLRDKLSVAVEALEQVHIMIGSAHMATGEDIDAYVKKALAKIKGTDKGEG